MQSESRNASSESQRIRRKSARIVWIRPVILYVDPSLTMLGHSVLLSVSGISMRVPRIVAKGKKVSVHILVNGDWRRMDGKVVFQNQPTDPRYSNLVEIGVAFINPLAGSHLWQAGKVQRSVSESGSGIKSE